MLSKQHIRGIVYLAVIVLVVALVAIFATKRLPITLKVADTPKVEEVATDTLFRFDPNTVTYDELCMLGVDKRTAVGIIKYRKAGKVFGIAEEFALCYGVSD